MRPPRNIFDAVNQRIWEFVGEDANLRLRPGTGSYSTLFRGSLFGLTESAAVAAELMTRGVDVLWLGTNPGVQQSLEYITNPPKGKGDFPTFERQMKSGLFASWRWDDHGQRLPDWNPIDNPDGNWKVYRDVLEAVFGRLDCVAMANFIPWGSRTTPALVEGLGTANRPLLERVLAFADDVNAEIVQALKPKLVVVPFSLGRLSAERPVGVAFKRATDRPPHTVALADSPRFNFYTGTSHRDRLTVPTVFLPHPASLRVRREVKPRLVEEVAKVLREL